MTTAWGGQPPNLNSATQTHWGNAAIGILGSVMKAAWTSGEHGPSPLANDALSDGLEYRWYVESLPSGCSIDATELGDAALTVPADGTYTWTYRLVESGVLLGAVGTVTTTVGTAASATVSVAAQGVITGVLAAVATGAGAAPVVLAPTLRRVPVGMAAMPERLPRMDVQEIDDITFDLAGVLLSGETIASAVVTADAHLGTDGNPAGVLLYSPQISGTRVLQRVRGQVDGVTYMLRCVATLSSGRQAVGAALLPVFELR